MATEANDGSTWLADLPPTASQTRAAVAAAVVALVAFAAVAPFAGTPLTELNALFPTLDAIVFISDLITAVLLFAQYSISRSRALFALASGYLFTALIVVPHALTFTGAFSPTGLLGANIQTGSWLFIFWHLGFALGLLGYALLREEKPKPISEASTLPAISWTVVIAIALVCGATWLATAGATYLPRIILDDSRISPFVIYPIWLTILVSAAALALLSIRRRSVLDQWLMVVALVYIMELAFSGLFPSVRFSAGFYAGRVFSLVTSSVVLIIVLAETIRLYARLARTNAMLQREKNNKLMSFEAIVASIGHEIKQPLAAIELNTASAHLFLEQDPPNLEEVRSILEEMKHDGRRIRETLDGIRSLFGKVDQRQQPTNLNDVVLDVLRSSTAELNAHAVTARTRLAAELPVVFGAQNQLYQAVYNLVHNGIEAMGSTTDRARILEVRTEHRNNAISIEVSDTGPGIDPARLPDMFEPFVTTKPLGMGLGLAICRIIVERHKGQLSAAPAQPHGTIFRIVLPLSRSACEPSREEVFS